MRIPVSALGKILEVEFLDHAIGDKDVKSMLCRIYGRVVSVNSKQVRIEHWTVLRADKETADDNAERVVIVQSTIVHWTELKPKRRGMA